MEVAATRSPLVGSPPLASRDAEGRPFLGRHQWRQLHVTNCLQRAAPRKNLPGAPAEGWAWLRRWSWQQNDGVHRLHPGRQLGGIRCLLESTAPNRHLLGRPEEGLRGGRQLRWLPQGWQAPRRQGCHAGCHGEAASPSRAVQRVVRLSNSKLNTNRGERLAGEGWKSRWTALRKAATAAATTAAAAACEQKRTCYLTYIFMYYSYCTGRLPGGGFW